MPSFSSHLFHRLFPSAASRVRPENIIKCKYSRQATRKYCEANIQNIVGKLPNMTIFMIEIYDQNVRHKSPPPPFGWDRRPLVLCCLFVCLSDHLVKEKQECPRKFLFVTGTLKHRGFRDCLSFARNSKLQQSSSARIF